MVAIIRWTARVLAVLLIMLFATMAIGEGVPSPWILNRPEKFMFLALFVMLAGLVSALRYEAAGGILVLLGYAVFALLNQEFIISWAFSLFPIAGLLFLLSWVLSRRRTITDAKTPSSPDTEIQPPPRA
jgi:hypothetical protein